jgi:hypothetical protein
MAKAKKKTGKGRAAKRPAARKSRKTAAAKRPARSAGASAKRIAQLEAENRQLRAELAALRAEREQAAAGEPGAEGEDRPPAADF